MEIYELYRLAIWLIARLPTPLVYGAAGALGELNFFFNRRSRRGVYANLRHVLPPDTGAFQRWRTARAAFRHFAYSIVDFFRIPLMTKANMDRFVNGITGFEHIESCLREGKGGIFVSVHMGSWELAGAYLGLRGVPLTAAVLPHKDPRIDSIFLRHREETGMEVVPVGGALARLEDAVRRGRIIALLADRDVKGRGPILPFFGAPTHMPVGHARLALNTGAWIIPGCIQRRHNGQQIIELRPPIIPNPAADTVESLTMKCMATLEDFIRSRPAEWFSFYDLWSDTELPVA